jgi:hypothetical protein
MRVCSTGSATVAQLIAEERHMSDITVEARRLVSRQVCNFGRAVPAAAGARPGCGG